MTTRPIQPIRTEEEYEQAVARLSELWGVEPGTPEADMLDITTALVADFEAEREPIGFL